MSDGPTAVRIDGAWHSGAPYSPAVRMGDLLFLSGLVPVDPRDGSTVGATIQDQTRQVLTLMRRLLAAGGATHSDVVKTTVFLTDPSLAAGMNEVYAECFSEPRPARSTVVVGPLARAEFLVEIEAIARIPSR